MPGHAETATVADGGTRVYGEVEEPAVLSYQARSALTRRISPATYTVSPAGLFLDSEWSGVRLATIMDVVKPRGSGAFVIFEAAAGFTSNVPIGDTLKENAILALVVRRETAERARRACACSHPESVLLQKVPSGWKLSGSHPAMNPILGKARL